MKNLCTIGFCLIATIAFSQQINVWRFGDGAGLDFNSGSPVALPAGAINSNEPAASVCDNQGQLQFYTDGMTVWNRNNITMANGTGLNAGGSTSQTLVVQKPGDCSKYYIFHSGDNVTGNIGGYYSLVDMCLNGGLGDVVSGSKNIQITPNCSEKWTAIKHSNGTDVWIICHDLGSATFRKFLLSPSGLSPATLQTIGTVHGNTCMIGCMKASHNGQKLVASTSFNCQELDMFDFNATTGMLSNHVDLDAIIGSNFYYGIEFSPNDQLLYLSDFYSTCSLVQVNLANNAVTTLATNGSNYAFGVLQLGPDGKIYMARMGQSYISAVTSPNTVGAGCGYVNSAVTLAAGTYSGAGLINAAPWVSTTTVPQYVSLGNDTALNCVSPIVLAAQAFCNATYLWSDASTNPTLTVNTAGTFWVQITNVCGVGRDTVVISGSSGNATAQFTTMGQTLCGSQIIFNNNSSGASSYLWNFGDNTTSTQTNPFHTYSAAGTYQVMLIASGACGSDTTYTTLVIDPSTAVAQFTSAGNNCGSPVTFTNTSLYATTYFWDFGDLSTSTATNPTHTYSTPGTYQIMLIADGPCDIDTTYALITIVPGVVNAAFTSVPSACVGNPVFFSNSTTGATTYAWDFGDMGSSASTSPAHIYTSAGTYTVTLIATGTCAADTISQVVTINPVPVAAIAGTDTICAGQTITLTASGGTGFQWSGGSTATTAAITVTPSSTTAYYVQVNNGSCVSQPDTHTVVVVPVQPAVITGPTAICVGQSVTLVASGGLGYQWSGGSSATTSVITVSPTTTTTYYVLPVSAQCTGTPDTHTVFVYPVPVVNASGNTNICSGQSTTLTATGGGSYQWSGGSTDTTASIVVSPTATTTYFVTASNGFCTSGYDTITVTVVPSPIVTIVGPSGVCPGDTLTLIAVGNATTYVWMGAASGTGTTITDVPTGQGNYYLIGYNSQGCSDTAMVSIGVYDPTSVAILGNDTICIGESTSLFCPGTGTYAWSPSTGLNSTSAQTVIATPTTSITYSLQVTDIHGCIGSDTFALVVEPCTGIEEASAAASITVYPNPANTVLNISFPYPGSTADVRIYNATGALVYASSNEGANGTCTIDAAQFAAGMYSVIVIQDGAEYITKVVIQR